MIQTCYAAVASQQKPVYALGLLYALCENQDTATASALPDDIQAAPYACFCQHAYPLSAVGKQKKPCRRVVRRHVRGLCEPRDLTHEPALRKIAEIRVRAVKNDAGFADLVGELSVFVGLVVEKVCRDLTDAERRYRLLRRSSFKIVAEDLLSEGGSQLLIAVAAEGRSGKSQAVIEGHEPDIPVYEAEHFVILFAFVSVALVAYEHNVSAQCDIRSYVAFKSRTCGVDDVDHDATVFIPDAVTIEARPDPFEFRRPDDRLAPLICKGDSGRNDADTKLRVFLEKAGSRSQSEHGLSCASHRIDYPAALVFLPYTQAFLLPSVKLHESILTQHSRRAVYSRTYFRKTDMLPKMSTRMLQIEALM